MTAARQRRRRSPPPLPATLLVLPAAPYDDVDDRSSGRILGKAAPPTRPAPGVGR
ncbi:hypothetical protein ACIPY6_08760 [Streptomyces sp. NPDC090054]|uniref:hypothetical protein n=1 Tax=Streptomyces sp. NPDC090054 TaxID=3365933 RepID=UPI003830293F